jgi:hypothetical protein
MSRPMALATWPLSRRQPDGHPGEGAARAITTARSTRPVTVAVRAGIVGLTLATAYIHSTLGGPLFTANAAGYVALAAAMIAPIPFVSRLRQLARPALAGYAGATIVGWLLIGPWFQLAYIAKGIEIVLIALLVLEMLGYDGGPVAIARRVLGGAARAAPVTVGAAGALVRARPI